MDDGGHLDSAGETSSEVPMISEEFSTLSIDGSEESSGEAQRREKDPRTIARKYGFLAVFNLLFIVCFILLQLIVCTHVNVGKRRVDFVVSMCFLVL